MDFDFGNNPYPSRRSPVLAPRGMVSTSQPLAAQAGLSMLQRGGNAVDAALATAIALTVLEPTANGIGSDAFALVWDGSRVHALNGSGRAPAATTVEALHDAGHTTVPARGWWPVTVPGAPRAWSDLHERFGRLPFEALFEPAISYAQHGFPVSPLIAHLWALASESTYAPFAEDPAFAPWYATFAPGGHPPRAGETWRSEGHARTLDALARSRSRALYEGDLGAALCRFARETGGTITEEDLAAHTSAWVEPISTCYRGYDVWEIPPNGQGIAVLIALNILEGYADLGDRPRDSVESLHRQIEALKLAYVDALAFVADPEHTHVPVAGLLSKDYADRRRALIGDSAREATPGQPARGGTVYLCAADEDGMMVSFIQSNYMGFGSGVVVPDTGIALHNRGYDFRTEAGHPNRLAPGKRPYHTIIPGFLTHQGKAVGAFGVMGGYMQAQGHLQMLVNTLDFAMQPQASLDAPRWRFEEGLTVSVESDTSLEIVEGLRARGHTIGVRPPGEYFGKGQIIWRIPAGYAAGSDKRADGSAAGY